MFVLFWSCSARSHQLSHHHLPPVPLPPAAPSLLLQQPWALSAPLLQMQSPRLPCLHPRKQAMNISPPKGRFIKDQYSFFSSLLEQIAPLTPHSPLCGTEESREVLLLLDTSWVLTQLCFYPLLPRPCILKADLSGLSFYIFPLVILYLKAVICLSVVVILTAIMFDAALERVMIPVVNRQQDQILTHKIRFLYVITS